MDRRGGNEGTGQAGRGGTTGAHTESASREDDNGGRRGRRTGSAVERGAMQAIELSWCTGTEMGAAGAPGRPRCVGASPGPSTAAVCCRGDRVVVGDARSHGGRGIP